MCHKCGHLISCVWPQYGWGRGASARPCIDRPGRQTQKAKFCPSTASAPLASLGSQWCTRDQPISHLNQSVYFSSISMLIPWLMDTECVPSFAGLWTHWTEVALTGHVVHLYVIPQVSLVLGSKLTITTAPSACHRIFEDLSINHGCKEKSFHAVVKYKWQPTRLWPNCNFCHINLS